MKRNSHAETQEPSAAINLLLLEGKYAQEEWLSAQIRTLTLALMQPALSLSARCHLRTELEWRLEQLESLLAEHAEPEALPSSSLDQPALLNC